MNEGASPVSVAILVLLSFISIIITGYLTIYCYSYFKFKEDDRSNIDDLKKEHWLAMERKPLIPGNFHTETIQPISSTQPSHSEEVMYSCFCFYFICVKVCITTFNYVIVMWKGHLGISNSSGLLCDAVFL